MLIPARMLMIVAVAGLAPACGKSDGKKEPAPAPAVESPVPPAPPAATPAAPAAPAAPTQAPTPAPVAAGGPPGSFPSIEAYCEKARAALPRSSCEDDTVDVGAGCSCEAAEASMVSGPSTLKAGAGPFKAARLVAIARSYRGYVACELAIQTAAGWFVTPAIEACADPPVSHDGDLPTPVVKTFRADKDAGGDVLVLAWKEQGKLARELRCTASADGAPSCAVKPAK